MFSKTILITLAFLALICIAAADAHRPRSWRAKRDVQPSTCSFMQCAVSYGNCGVTGSSLQFCPDGQHCATNNSCADDIPLGGSCNPSAQENECAQGTCVDSGNGPVCQIYQEIMPGNPCTADSQCYFSQNYDGSGSVASTCDPNTKLCAGRQSGESCVASHQCYVGTFCSPSTLTCQSLGQSGSSCNNDTECDSRFTCFNGACSSRYSQSSGQSCSSTINCQPGLYCKSGTCQQAKTSSSSGSACDISSNSCPADEQCACQGFSTSGQTATCANIVGTYSDMPNIESQAYACLDKYACGSDFGNSTTIKCVSSNCMKEYCTYFTRAANDLFTDFPTCLVARMVDNADYNNLLSSCAAYKPNSGDGSNPSSTSASSFLSASISWISFVSLAVFFFYF